MTVLGGLLRRAISFQDVFGKALDVDGWGATTTAGVSVTAQSSLQLTAVFACVRLLAETVGSLPIDAYVRRGRTRLPYEPGVSWLDQPNPETTSLELWEQAVASLNLAGDAFLPVVRDRLGEPVELWIGEPDRFNPVRDSRRRLWFEQAGGPTLAPATRLGGDLLHIKAFSVPGQLRGISPIEKARQAIGLGMAAEEYGARFFGQGAHAGGHLEAEADPGPAAIKAMLEGWKKNHAGLRNAHVPGVLTGGVKWVQTSIPPEQAQFLETRRFQVTEIARLFRVPPHMIADLDRATFSNIEHQAIDFVTHSIRPWVVRLEQATRRLLPDGVRARWNVEGLLRGDTKTRFEAYGSARQWGWKTVNEIRAKEDLPPVDGGDVLLEPENMRPAGSESVGLGERINAAGVLVRSGFDPTAALSAVGLDPITHTGLLPVTVQASDDDATVAAAA